MNKITKSNLLFDLSKYVHNFFVAYKCYLDEQVIWLIHLIISLIFSTSFTFGLAVLMKKVLDTSFDRLLNMTLDAKICLSIFISQDIKLINHGI